MNCNPSSPQQQFIVTEARAKSVAEELTGHPSTVKKVSRARCRIRAQVGGQILTFNGKDWFTALLGLKTKLSAATQNAQWIKKNERTDPNPDDS